jgi:hypothetical protein
MNVDSPFEQWRLKYMKGMAVSREIMELLALAFEGGRVAEREACAKLCDGHEQSNLYGFKECAAAIRARKNHEQV